jgi:putative endonuclease
MEHDKGTKSVWPGNWMSKDRERTWVCYILRCADDTLYCGITIDLDKRLAAHNQGTAAKYTRARGPVELLFMESCADKSAALKREMKIKSLSRTGKLTLIESARK